MIVLSFLVKGMTVMNFIRQWMFLFYHLITKGWGIVGIEAQLVVIPCLFSENFPLKTKISPNVKYISLEESSENSAKEAIELSKLGIARDNTYAFAHGNDIKKKQVNFVEFMKIA